MLMVTQTAEVMWADEITAEKFVANHYLLNRKRHWMRFDSYDTILKRKAED